MKKTEFKIGEVILIDHKLERVATGINRNWIPKSIAPKNVYVVGMRTLSNGKMIDAGDDMETHLEFEAIVHFPAVMVTKGMFSKPFFVLHDKES